MKSQSDSVTEGKVLGSSCRLRFTITRHMSAVS